MLFELRDRESMFALPYRMILAVATQNSVLLYDTQQPEPFGIVSNIHYTRLTDLTWWVAFIFVQLLIIYWHNSSKSRSLCVASLKTLGSWFHRNSEFGREQWENVGGIINICRLTWWGMWHLSCLQFFLAVLALLIPHFIFHSFLFLCLCYICQICKESLDHWSKCLSCNVPWTSTDFKKIDLTGQKILCTSYGYSECKQHIWDAAYYPTDTCCTLCGNSAVTVKTTVSKLFSSMEETVGHKTVCQTCNHFIFFNLVISVSVS